MKPTDEIDDPTWHDLFDRDDEIKRLEKLIKGQSDQVKSLDGVVEFLKGQVQMAPCLVSRPGEGTYECRHDKPCRVCEWRREVHKALVEEWHIEEGIW